MHPIVSLSRQEVVHVMSTSVFTRLFRLNSIFYIIVIIIISITVEKRIKCLSGAQQLGAVYRFSFDVSPSDVLELDATLGDCLLHDPLKAVSLFQSVSCTNKIQNAQPTSQLPHVC